MEETQSSERDGPAGSAAESDHSASILRVLVVRDDALAGRLRGLTPAAGQALSVVMVSSFLSAMGELSLRSADAVIGPASAVTGMVQSIAASLRKLAPDARLVVLTGPEHRAHARQAVAAGFDTAVDAGADDHALAQSLGLTLSSSSEAAPPPELSSEADPSPAAVAPTEAPGLEPAVEPAGPAAPPLEWSVVDQQCHRALAAVEADPNAPTDAPPKPGEEMGDIDLVDAVMAGPERLPKAAVSVVLARSGIAGLAFEDDPDAADDAEGRVVQRVEHGGVSFGVLHGPPDADPRQIAGWAGWLARWLALDRQMGQLRELSMRDEMTGVFNRRYFDRFLGRILQRAQHHRRQVTLLVFDIDDFKQYNDRYGHAAGDEVLRETARLMQSVVRDHDVVARIGGDEFAVIFWDPEGPRHAGSRHPQDVVEATRRFQQAVCAHRFPKLLDQAEGTLTISGGLANYPWDGRTAEGLLELADQMAIRSKRQGKNVMSFGPGAQRRCGLDGERE